MQLANQEAELVAPFTGAWIETTAGACGLGGKLVAPFTGAWIETCARGPNSCRYRQSHPLRVRGLKPRDLDVRYYPLPVAPFTGAWIET